ncbi:hypothetical protein FDJ23_gp063 [Erwinia phage vB_EamM_Desertfox]|uniref:Uncharacterized protein n=2 Tax=Agricanvirus TaxID=1984776 RepID=A0A2H5BIN1_9CAUD|nr:hypothetical protein FDJ23_gp063 [Erwinia phage vB_EamM_Desertfox]AUG86171.1 hypothetical protein DESERTFOX_63 [Erwinia phage vB_EamM_Desertfox]AUG86814.1 hypothetical protein MORTIMER_65 [Erwinia phage vB_EamM_Mortimer]
MEKITSDTILAKLHEVAETNKENQHRKLRSISQTMAYNIEAIVELIALSGEMHLDLLDRRKVDEIIEPHYKGNQRAYSRLSHTASIHTGMEYLAGNAHIYTNNEGKEAVRIVCTFKFKRDFLQPSLLPKVLHYCLQELQPQFDDGGSSVFFHTPGELDNPRLKAIPGWHVDANVRDNSIVISLR